MRERRDTPTVRPGSSSTMPAQSPGELAAKVRLALHGLGVSFDRAGRAQATRPEVLEAIPMTVLVDARHLLDVFSAWEHQAPGDEVQKREIRRYLEWTNTVAALKDKP
jgi:hypothetical protein